MIVPSKPGKPTASNVTHDSIRLEWTKPEQGAHNVTSYNILYRFTDDLPDQWMEQKTKSAKEGFVFSQLSEKTTYLFKVQPVCDTGVGLESDISEPIMTKMVSSRPRHGKPRAIRVSNLIGQLEVY